jgi:hypothetical protein
MKARTPIPDDITFQQAKDGYQVIVAENDLYIFSPIGASLYIPYHPYKSDRYTLNYDEINCSKQSDVAWGIYCEDLSEVTCNNDLWKTFKNKIDALISSDICKFPYV